MQELLAGGVGRGCQLQLLTKYTQKVNEIKRFIPSRVVILIVARQFQYL